MDRASRVIDEQAVRNLLGGRLPADKSSSLERDWLEMLRSCLVCCSGVRIGGRGFGGSGDNGAVDTNGVGR